MWGHPWMVQGYQSYYGVQGYSDRVVGSECGGAIHASASMDSPGMSELLQGYSDRVVRSECGAIHGWSRDV